MFAAHVNQAAFAASFAQIAYDSEITGDYTDIEIGQTVLIGRDINFQNAYWAGRVRKAPTSNTLYINETSVDIDDGDYIFVIDDYRIWDKLARYVSGTIYIDYEVTFRQLLPLVYGLKGAYADFVSSNVLTVSFAPLAVAATSGSTISTWAWDVGDGTITVGNASTQNITVTFPPGFRWVKLTVTDSGSRSTVRRIPVWAHHPDTYPPQLLAVGSLDLSASIESGYDATVPAYNSLGGVADNTLVCAWGVDTYNGSQTNITGDNIIHVGRIRQSSDTSNADPDAGIVKESRLTIEGPLTQLARIEQLTFEVRYDATPTIWGDIKDATLWRSIHFILSEFSTFENVHSLAFDSTANTFVFYGTKTQGGNILSAINDLAESINAAIQMNSNGSAEIVRDGNMIDTASRSSLVTVAALTTADIIDLQYEHEHVKTVGRIQASGGVYNTSSSKVTPLLSLAPGVAQDYPEGQGNLTRQVLQANQTQANAQSELNRRSGFAFAKANSSNRLTITFPGGYYWLTPSLNQWYTFQLNGTETVREIVLDIVTRWVLISVSVTHDGVTGTKTVQAVFTQETTAPAGQTVTAPTVTQTPTDIPQFPPFPPIPSFPTPPIYLPDDPIGDQIPPVIIGTDDVPRNDGNAVVIWTLTQLFRTNNFLATTTPDWVDVTPDASGFAVKHFIFYPWNANNKGALCLMSDGTDSVVYRTTNVFANPVTWTAGTTFSGVYSVIRPITTTAGVIYVIGNSSNGGEFTVDGEQDEPGLNTGLYFNAGDTVSATATGLWGYNAMGPIFGPDGDTGVTDPANLIPSADVMSLIGRIGTSGAWTLLGSSGSFVAATSGYLYLIGNDAPGSFYNNSGSVDVVIGGGAGSTRSRYSTDYGDTMAAAVVVGISAAVYPSVDTSKGGAQILAGAGGQTRKTTAGGAYADYGSAKTQGAIHVPRYQFGSTVTGNTGSNPQYLLAALALDSGESLWKVTASGATFTDISPTISGDTGLALGANCIHMPWKRGDYILAILMFGSLPKMVVSTTSGASWVSAGVLDASASYVRTRKNDLTYRQAFLTNGGPAYTSNYRAGTIAIVTKSYPSSDAVLGIEPFGG